jgi:cytochrome c oxidase assembly protein subunit 15
MLHGCGGPIVFAVAVFMALAASKDWRGASATIESRGMSRLSTALLLGTILQLYLGAQLRHTLPSTSPVGFLSMVHLHLTVALLLALLILLIAFVVRRRAYSAAREIRTPANVLLLLLFVQLTLGLATWVANYALPWSELTAWLSQYVISAKGYWESFLVTGHQATGSLMIAAAVWLVCRVWRRQAKLVSQPVSSTISEAAVSPFAQAERTA